MKKIKIGVCGNKGSFSEEAAEYYCQKNGIENYEIKYLVTAEKTLSAVSAGKINKGIFPIENSNGGIVLESVHAMSNYVFEIEKIFEIDIKHFLLVLPGTKTSEIKKIASHPQALKQCRMYLKRRWEKTELEEYSDTAQAAKDLSEGKIGKEVAVIAPEICSKLYGLEVMEENIQDLKFNFTSFVVATKERGELT